MISQTSAARTVPRERYYQPYPYPEPEPLPPPTTRLQPRLGRESRDILYNLDYLKKQVLIK